MGADVGRKDRNRDMTPEKAIEYLEITKTCAGDDHKGYLIKEMCSAAIAALEEIQQYREIGTVEECREAVEKQKPEAPAVDKYHHTCCPSCGWVVAGDTGYGKEYLPHCENCGQKILWDERMEETEDDG